MIPAVFVTQGGSIKRVLGIVGAAMLLAAAFAPAASAGGAAITARGSVEQVDVTGATPGASYSLIDSNGKVTDTRKGGSLGGIVFRNVDPGIRLPGPRGRQGRHHLAALQGPQQALGPAQHQHLQPDASRRAATAT